MEEFEIRIINISSEKFKEIFNHCQDNHELIGIEKSVNFIQNLDNRRSLIKKQIYNGGTIYYIKQQIARKYIYGFDFNITANFSKETNVSERNIATNFIRIKARISYSINESWRVDLTIVGHSDTVENSIPKAHLFFKNVNEDNFFANEKEIDSYEVELEYIGKEYIDLNMILDSSDKILSFINIYKDRFYEVINLLGANPRYIKNVDNISNKVISLNRYNYYRDLYPTNGFLITEKSDGERAIVHIVEKKAFVFLTRKTLEYKLEKSIDVSIILDAEFFIDTSSIYVFDVLYFGENCMDDPYTDRLDKFSSISKIVSQAKSLLHIYFKKFFLVNNNLQSLIERVYLQNESSISIDGIIFSTPDKNYYNTINYKWKPYNNNTIDFYVKKKGKDKYYLYCYITRELSQNISFEDKNKIEVPNSNIVHVLFAPSVNPSDYILYDKRPLDGAIVEVGKDRRTESWKVVRIRKDKTLENAFRTAEGIYMNFYNPFDIELLYNPDVNIGYFKSSDSKEIFKSIRSWNNCVKYFSFGYAKNAKLVIDLASGRGGDLIKYSANNIAEVVMVENDLLAIEEIVNRKYEVISSSKYTNPLSIKVLNIDLNNNSVDNYEKILDLMGNYKRSSYVVCHLALHYMTETEEALNNIINLINLLTERGGLFICSVMNGRKVKSLLTKNSDNKGSFVTEEGFEIHASNLTDNIFGNKIRILLPFSGDELYEEYLLDIENFILTMKKSKFKNIYHKSFLDIGLELPTKDYNIPKLNENEKKYVNLYDLLVFEKR